MNLLPFMRWMLVSALFWVSAAAYGDVERILVQTEIDDDHIIVVTEDGEQLLLEKWSMRFSPLLFEGKTFLAEVSPIWVTIHIPDQEPIKWSVEKSFGHVGGTTPKTTTPPAPAPRTESRKSACYKTNIQEPSPFNGNGGELIMLADGSIWKEVSYQYLYLYEYYPSVVVCPSEGRMILKDHIFQIVRQR